MQELTGLAEQFWAKVTKTEACWLYGRSAAYGNFRRQGAHRVAWVLTNGPIPPGLSVLHHCDTPPCVRPDHLFLGTQTDNMRDAATKGRFGDHTYLSAAEVARRLGLAPDTVRRQITNGRISGEKFGRDWLIHESEVHRYRAEVQRQKEATA